MTQDGFYEGELLDGRKGLVPSNFIQRLQGEDLVEFHRAAVLGLQICGDDSSTTSLPRDLLGVSPNHPSSHLAGRVGQHPIHQIPILPQHQQQPHLQPIPANEPVDQGQSKRSTSLRILKNKRIEKVTKKKSTKIRPELECSAYPRGWQQSGGLS